MGFNFPRPPLHAVVPATAQTVADLCWGALALIAIVYAIVEWRRTQSLLPIILILGGAIAYLNEPIVDVLGLCWHPRVHQQHLLSTFGPLPLWGLFAYVVFFGAGPYIVLKLLRRGITRRQFWYGVAGLMAVNLGIEIPLLPTHLYLYYGYHQPPMTVAHLPLYWLFLNVGGPLLAATVLFAAEGHLSGRSLLTAAALIPMTTYAAFSLAAGWPIFSALHSPGLDQGFVWGAALLTILISAWILDRIAVYVHAQGASGTVGVTSTEMPPTPRPLSVQEAARV
ncbi:MAG: hypothetical protein ACYDHH_02360 [Solirubrobacteraceae bacterium]